MRELQAMDVSSYLNFVRMNASTFETLLTKVAPLIARKDTHMRDAIPPGERLAVTLRFLATGENKRPACIFSNISINCSTLALLHWKEAIFVLIRANNS